MTPRDIHNEWRKLLSENREQAIPFPVTEDYLDTPVIFPDGSPVREVRMGFIGGCTSIVLSGERKT